MNEQSAQRPSVPEQIIDANQAQAGGERLLSADAFIMRLAQELRSKGDPELPLSLYLDQARHLLLSGKTPQDAPSSASAAHAANDHVYQSWALSRS
jgi:hypothetical protein